MKNFGGNNKPRKLSKVDSVPTRYILTLLIFCGMSLIFGQRVCLNVAMVTMVNSSAEVDLLHQPAISVEQHCPEPENSFNATSNQKQGIYPWTPYTQGIILASYFYGYVVSQLIGGKVADLVGAKRLFGCATFLSSIMTCITPTISAMPSTWIIALRVLLGFVHGMNYPSAYTLLSRWSPVQERSTLLSACVIGTHFGVVLSMSLTGYLCENGFAGGWPSAFYFLGTAGFVWSLFWMFFVFESPDNHPRITVAELDYIQRNILHASSDKKAVPWGRVLCSPPVWAVTVAKFCGAWSFICFQSKLPAYLDEVLHMSIQKNGLVNALLFGALCLSTINSGKLSDWIRGKDWFKITTIRKTFETFALLGPAACMIAIPLVKCDEQTVVILLTSSMALFGLCGGGDVPVIVDMTPDYAGKVFGVSNAIASIPGILSPVLAGYLLEGNKGDIGQWTYIFYTSVGMYLFGTITFVLFGSGEVQEWGRQPDDSLECSPSREKRTLSMKEANLLYTVPVILTVGPGDCKEAGLKDLKF